mgnify:CR=1 FL=1
MEEKVIFGTFEDVTFTDVSGEKISEVKTIAKLIQELFQELFMLKKFSKKMVF